MASFRALHVVCLFSWLLLRAWRTDCQSNSHLPCSEHLGAYRLSNLQTPPKGKEPQICVSETTCCTRQTEDNLRVKAAKKIRTHIQTKYSAARSSLLSLFEDLKAYFQSVIRESHRQSALFFLKSQKNLTNAEVQVISTFFKDLENYVVDDQVDLEDIVNTFFRDSFPLVLEYANPSGKTVSNLYKQCLKTNMKSIQPFGKRPAQLVGIFEQVFEPVRSLLNSFKFSVEVMNMAQQFNFTSGCKNVLLQMKFCSLCQGVENVKPCYSYCKDALRECMRPEVKLQKKWSLYINNVYLLAQSIGASDLENFANSIYKDLWSAAMHLLLQKQNVMKQVLDKCGKPEYIDAGYEYVNSIPPTSYVKVQLSTEMEAARMKVFALKSFYHSLPDELCIVDELSAKQVKAHNCWNGNSVASYTGLDSTPGDFEMSTETTTHLQLLEAKIHDRNAEIRKFITHNNVVDEEGESVSGSGSGSGGESGCDDDDEDCASGSGDPVRNIITDVTFEENNDLYLSDTTTGPSSEDGGVQAGGVATTAKPGNVLAQENMSPISTASSLVLLALLFFGMLIQKW